MLADRLLDQLSVSIAATQGCQSAHKLKDSGCVPHTEPIPLFQLLAPKPLFPTSSPFAHMNPLKPINPKKKAATFDKSLRPRQGPPSASLTPLPPIYHSDTHTGPCSLPTVSRATEALCSMIG